MKNEKDQGNLYSQSQFNKLAPIPKRFFRRFNHLHHTQPRQSVRLGRTFVLNTVDEVQCLCMKCLGVVETWSPHVARPVTHKHLVDGLRARCDSYALVVNLQFIAWLEIVVDN